MSDDADCAQQMQDAEREAGIAAVRAELAGPGRVICGRCGDPIPPERREALKGACMCVDCQEDLERLARLSRLGR